VAINMVATIDGKILSGERDDSVLDLGSKTDHLVMKRIEARVDAVMIGAQTLRASPKTWNPGSKRRIVVTGSGDVPFEAAFLAHGEPCVATTRSASFPVPPAVQVIRAGDTHVEPKSLLRQLREAGVERLLILGGSELNAQVIHADLADELFLTIAPKVKLGRDVPTYADGDALPRQGIQQYSVVEHHLIGNEIFIRYRRNR